MTLPRHLEEAVSRLNEASWRIDQAKERPLSLESLQEWLSAVTDYTSALTDIQQANNESIHEKLHELAGHAGIKKFRSSSPKE